MPESPLVQKETVSLADLEALIAARAKGESETELGFRKRIDREEAEYRAAAKHLGEKYKVDNAAMEADYARARNSVIQTFQRDTQATKAEYEQTKKQIDDTLKKDTRRAKKSKEETGWQALAMFEGQRDEGIKWRRGTEAAWNEEIAFLHAEQDNAEYVLKRCGRLAKAALAEAAATTEAAAPGEPPQPRRLKARPRRRQPRLHPGGRRTACRRRAAGRGDPAGRRCRDCGPAPRSTGSRSRD